MTEQKETDDTQANSSEVCATNLFKDVNYYLVGTIDEKVVKLLNDGGGKQDNYLSEMVSHVIADSTDQDEYCEAKELFDLPVVMSQWVTLSAKCQRQLPVEKFSPEGLLFSGIVVCPKKLVSEDQRNVWGMVTYNGGVCRGKLGHGVTHLVTADIDTAQDKYSELVERDGVKIVSPDWITDSLEQGKRLDEVLYHPSLIHIPSPPRLPKIVTPPEVRVSYAPDDSNLDPFNFTGIDDSSRHDPYTAKEALARMVNNRLQACGKSPEGHGKSPTPMLPLAAQSDTTVYKPLRNITNGAEQIAPPVLITTPTKPVISKTQARSWPVGIHQAKSGPFIKELHPPRQPTYSGHDANDKIPTDMCLLGCIFYVAEYQKTLGPDVISTWKQVIEQHGGQVDPAYSNRVTHLLCPHQQSDVFQLALKDGRRVVTAYWLNDCLTLKCMSPPWQALHLPVIYGDHRPCTNQIITISNYFGEERMRIKQMLTAVGAKYTGYMAHSNSVLICKTMDGVKYQKALEWQIPVVNVTWVSDLVLGNLDALRLPVNPKYLSLGHPDEFNIDVTRVAHLMVGWRNPLKVTKEALRKFIPSPKLKNKKLAGNVDVASAKRKADEDMDNLAKRQRVEFDRLGKPLPSSMITSPVVTFTGYRGKTLTALKTCVLELGGRVSEHPRECTHLVAQSLVRTVKMFMSINVVRAIVTKEWLNDSHYYRHFLDEQRYMLKDRESEAELNCDLTESLHRARLKPLFLGLSFYLTPSVMPSPTDLANVIETASGKVLKKLPSAKKIIAEITEKGYSSYIIITCPNDIQLCRPHITKSIPVHSAEYVLTGVLRQEIDNQLFRLEVT